MSQYPYSTISTTVTSTNTVPKVKTNWPLVFETNGASYIYQTQTGLFYDTVQKYYYCTKSKLYYNEADGTYLSQAPPGSEVPFVLFEPPEPSTLPSEEVLSVEVLFFLFFFLFSHLLFFFILLLISISIYS